MVSRARPLSDKPPTVAATRAARIHVTTGFAHGVLFRVFGVAALVYWVEIAELSALELVLTGTALEVAYFVSETPTGVLADFYSRKWSIVVAYTLFGIGIFLTGVATSVVPVMIAQVIWGVGFTFQSGATTAWVTDEINDQSWADELILRRARARLVGSVFGTIIGIVGGAWSLAWTIRLAGIASLALAVVLAVTMTENGFSPAEERTTWKRVIDQAADGLRRMRGAPVVMTILAAALFVGLASEAVDRLWVLHLVDDVGIPERPESTVVWTGGVQLVGLLAGAAFLTVAQRRPPQQRNVTTVLGALAMVAALSVLALALAPIYAIAAAGFIGRDLTRGVMAPLEQTAINREAVSEVRATMLSLHGQVDSLGQIVGGVALALVASAAGTMAAFVASAALYAVAAGVLAARVGARRAKVDS